MTGSAEGPGREPEAVWALAGKGRVPYHQGQVAFGFRKAIISLRQGLWLLLPLGPWHLYKTGSLLTVMRQSETDFLWGWGGAEPNTHSCPPARGSTGWGSAVTSGVL